MIFIKNPVWIKIWEINPKEKYIDIRFSTSEKRDDGKYINSNWFGRCFGKAKDKFLSDNIKVGDRIRMTSGKITAEVYLNSEGEKRTAPTRVLVYDYDKGEKSDNSAPESPIKKPKKSIKEKPESPKSNDTSSDDDDDYPF